MHSATLARIAALMVAVQLSPAALALCAPGPGGCGCGLAPPCPAPPPPPPPPALEPPLQAIYVGPAQGILDGRPSIWQSPDQSSNPVPGAVTQVAFRSDIPVRNAGTALALSLDADNTWASMSSAIDLNLQLGANALRLTSTGLAGDTPALGVLAGQTRLANGTVHADAGDVRVGSGNSGASLVLDNGAQLLMANTNLGKVFVATGGAGRDGLLRLDHGAVLRTDQVHLGSLLAAGSGRLELSGSGSQVDTSLRHRSSANGSSTCSTGLNR